MGASFEPTTILFYPTTFFSLAILPIALLFAWGVYILWLRPAFLSPYIRYPGPPVPKSPLDFFWGKDIDRKENESRSEKDGGRIPMIDYPHHWLFGQFGWMLKEEPGVLQRDWAFHYGWGKGTMSKGAVGMKQPPEQGAIWEEELKGKVIRAVGPFGLERLMFLTPKAYHDIFVEQTNDFPKPLWFRKTLMEVIGYGLVALEGDEHARLRKLMSPAFTTPNIARMVPTFWPICTNMRKVLEYESGISSLKPVGSKSNPNPFLNLGLEDSEEGGKEMFDAEPKELDLGDLIRRTSLDISAWTGFGYKTDSLIDESNPLARAYHVMIDLQDGPSLATGIALAMLPSITDHSALSFLHPISNFFSNAAFTFLTSLPFIGRNGALAPVVQFKEAIKEVKRVGGIIARQSEKWCDEEEEEKRREKEQELIGGGGDETRKKKIKPESFRGRKDVMSLMVRGNRASGGKLLNEPQMVDQVLSILTAGQDTMSAGATWLFWLIATHPEVQSRLRHELITDLIPQVRERYKKEMIEWEGGDQDSDDEEEEEEMRGPSSWPNMQELGTNTYLDAVVRESIRLMPAIPVSFREAMKDTVVDGVPVTKGTIVYLGFRVTNTLPEYWGVSPESIDDPELAREEALKFKPERWIGMNMDSEGAKAYGSFGSGPHRCPGQALAYVQFKALVYSLLPGYEFSPAPGCGLDDVVTQSAISMKPRGHLKVLVRKLH